MKKVVFQKLPINQPQLFPVYLLDHIPDNHSFYLVNQVLNLGITLLPFKYKVGGERSIHPGRMVKVWLYSYLSNN